MQKNKLQNSTHHAESWQWTSRRDLHRCPPVWTHCHRPAWMDMIQTAAVPTQNDTLSLTSRNGYDSNSRHTYTQYEHTVTNQLERIWFKQLLHLHNASLQLPAQTTALTQLSWILQNNAGFHKSEPMNGIYSKARFCRLGKFCCCPTKTVNLWRTQYKPWCKKAFPIQIKWYIVIYIHVMQQLTLIIGIHTF